MTTAQRVVLTMIVRNERHVIGRCLDSVIPYITDWCVVDTGSTDGTQELVMRKLCDSGKNGRLYNVEWTDFSTARNQSLDFARRDIGTENTYSFVIDADEELVQTDSSAQFGPFEADSYSIRLRMAGSDSVWCRRQLFRLSRSWHYEDEIHERSVCEEPGLTAGGLTGFEILSYNDSARNKDGLKQKAKRDAKTLRAMLKRKPNDPRLTYYLAQTLMNAGDLDGAIDLHEKRLTLGGFDEERYSSALHIAAMREARGDHADDVIAAYLRAYEIRPTRAEPLWAVAAMHNDRGKPALAELYARAACRIPRPTDALVVNEAIYKWMAADELAGALGKLGRLEEARVILRRLNEFPELPAQHRERVAANLAEAERLCGDG